MFALHIRELVIEGFPPGESRAIAAALEQELGRLLGDGAPPFAGPGIRHGPGDLTVDRLDAGTVTGPPDTSPRAFGQAAAHAIVRRLRALPTGHDPVPVRKDRA